MKNYAFFLSVIASLCSGNVFALSPDVVPESPKKGDLYVKVTRVGNDQVRFEKCFYPNGACTPMGKRNAYPYIELKSQRNSEYVEIGLSTVGAVGTLVVAVIAVKAVAVGALAVTGASLSTTAVVGLGVDVAGNLIGIGGGVAIASQVASLNPYEQYQQSKVLDAQVINDDDVKVEDTKAFIERLELVLSKI